MRVVETDHYAILGVGQAATPAEIRRAFRRLALQFHPDRAGTDSTPVFQHIARAYSVLSDAATRRAYDTFRRARMGDAGRNLAATRRQDRGVHLSKENGPTSRAVMAAQLRREGQLLERLSRHLDELLAAGIAVRTDGGEIDLSLTPSEAQRGGVALIDMLLTIACSTCCGIARPGRFWCLRCDSTGRMREVVTVYCAIHPAMADATILTIPTDSAGGLAAIRLRLRVISA